MNNLEAAHNLSQDRVTRLDSIDLGLLAKFDSEEEKKLLCAAQKKGFFYVDLENPEGRAYLTMAESLFSLFKDFFEKPLPEKLLQTRLDEIESRTAGYVETLTPVHARDMTTFSYKPIGQ